MTRKILATILAITMVITSMSTMVFAEETIVNGGGSSSGTKDPIATELPEAVDGVITLTEDVELPKDTRFSDEMEINLNGHTLYVTTSVTFNADATIYGGTINADEQTAPDGLIRVNYHHTDEPVSLTLTNVTVSALDSVYATGVFYLHTANNTLTLDNVTVNVSGANDDPGAGVFYSPSSFDRGNVILTNETTLTTDKTNAIFFATEVDIDNATITCDNVYRPVFRQAAGVVEDTTITVKSIEEGRAVIEDVSGQNSGAMMFRNSTVTAPEGTTIAKFNNEGSIACADSTSSLGDGSGVSAPIAIAGGTAYATLQDAMNEAQNGDTVTLMSNISLDEMVSVSGTVTLDLNGYTVSTSDAWVTSSVNDGILAVNYGGDLTIKDSSADKTGVIDGSAAYEAVKLTEKGEVYSGSPAKLTIDSGTLIGNYYAVVGNGGRDNTEITVNGGTLKGVASVNAGIYHPQDGTLTINGGTIEGYTGIYMAAGTLVVPGSSSAVIIGNGAKTSYDPTSNSGFQATGDAVVIDNRNTGSNGYGAVSANIEGGAFTSANASAVTSYAQAELTPITGFISGGNFSSNISEYLADGLVAVTSSQSGYKYSVAEKAVDVETTITPAAPSVSVEEGITINTENFAADNDDLNAAAASLANDSSVVGTKEDAKTALTDAEITVTDDDTVSVVVVPYTDINVSNVDTENETMTVSISPKYDVVATTNSSEIITEGEGVNAVVLNEAQTLEVTTPMSITLALPTDYAEANDTIYVHHEVDGTTYVYEATVSEDAATATFTNNNGFESTEFVVKKAAGAAKIGDTVYATLADAVKNVAANETIVLLADNAETVTVAKTITFSLDKDIYAFTGEIDNGSYTKVTTTENGNVITYTFRYTSQNLGGGGGGGGSMVSAYTVKVKNTDNGNITASAKTAKKGAIVTLSVVADDGYELKAITVTDNDNEEVDVTEEAGNYVFKMPGSDVVVTAEFVAEGTAQEPDTEDNTSTFPFIDIAEDFWGYEAIAYCWENGIMNGMTETEFDQARPLTRAMLVTMLYRLAGTPEVVTTENEWYSAAQAWAMESGISDGTFMTNEVTREQLVTMLYRYAGMIEADLTAEAELTSFTDNAEISEYATDAAEWAFANGLINGMGDGTLAPKSSATRAQVAAMFMRFIENIVK